jgi:hypothetical protein
VVRNALPQSIKLEISNDQFSHVSATSKVEARWELPLHNLKIENKNTLAARVLEDDTLMGKQEIAHCQSTLSDTVKAKNLAVVIYTVDGVPSCSIVNLTTGS